MNKDTLQVVACFNIGMMIMGLMSALTIYLGIILLIAANGLLLFGGHLITQKGNEE